MTIDDDAVHGDRQPLINSPDQSSILLLDGAMGTELGRRGADISLPLWSARAIRAAPALIAQIHREYLEAGADLITANTFRTHRRSLAKAGLGDQARSVTEAAVRLAREARDQVNPKARVLGSVAPLEDCYQPRLAPDAETCAREHREMIEHLYDAGVDLILIETMNNLREAAAAARAAQEIAGPRRWMISFCTKSEGPPNILLSGEAITDLLPQLGEAFSIGINCVAAASIEPEIRLLKLLAPHDVRISAYGNVGRAAPEGDWIATDAVDPARYAEYAARWMAAGATIIGGCCGTTPAVIQAVRNRLRVDS